MSTNSTPNPAAWAAARSALRSSTTRLCAPTAVFHRRRHPPATVHAAATWSIPATTGSPTVAIGAAMVPLTALAARLVRVSTSAPNAENLCAELPARCAAASSAAGSAR